MSDKTTEKGYIRLPEILKLIPIGRSTWWAKVKSGEYPKGIKLSSRTTAWLRSDINALLDSFLENKGLGKQSSKNKK